MKRDKSLDVIKGLACILMIFAHSYGYGKTTDNWWTLLIYKIGLFAPVLFLGSVGVSVFYQAKKKFILLILVNYLLLFAVSFANMGLRLNFNEYLTLDDWNLYAGIAFSAILTLFILNYTNIFVTLTPIVLLFLLNKTGVEVSLFYGGLFSIIPWSSFTFMGRYLHSHKYFIKVLFMLSLVLSLTLIIFWNQITIYEYNSPVYITLSFLIYSFSLMIATKLIRINRLSELLVYLGQNSLLFYVVHRLIVIYLPFKLFAPVLWVALFTGTLVFMYISTKLNSLFLSQFSDNYIFWALLVIAIIVPSIISMDISLQRPFMFGVLLLHALNYHNFTNLGIFKKYQKYHNEK